MIRLDENGYISLHKEMTGFVMTNKKFNIKKGANRIITGPEAYFIDGCPKLTVSSYNDLNHLM